MAKNSISFKQTKEGKRLKERVKRSVEKLKDSLIQEISEQMNRVRIVAGNEFYDDYKPKRYKRKYHTYEGFKITHKKGKDKVTINLIVSPDNIEGEPYITDKANKRPTKEWVFRNTFDYGYHGVYSKNRDENKHTIGILGTKDFIPERFVRGWYNYFKTSETKTSKSSTYDYEGKIKSFTLGEEKTLSNIVNKEFEKAFGNMLKK